MRVGIGIADSQINRSDFRFDFFYKMKMTSWSFEKRYELVSRCHIVNGGINLDMMGRRCPCVVHVRQTGGWAVKKKVQAQTRRARKKSKRKKSQFLDRAIHAKPVYFRKYSPCPVHRAAAAKSMRNSACPCSAASSSAT